jgi:phospholipid/cholesterol/gamma-HCH transport system ATP-binding protein
MIRVEHLYKKFAGTSLYRDLSIYIDKGEFVALIGKSGHGKSVLLKHLTGLMRPDSGSIHIDGHDLHALPRNELQQLREGFGFVFQSGALFDSMTVFDNLAFPLRERTRMKESEIRGKVMHELEGVGLLGSEDKYPAQISGGMIKRAALARALVIDPKIVFFDEPTTGLDPIIAHSIIDLIHESHHRVGFTGIIVTHQIPDIFDVASKVALLHDGRVWFMGTPEEIQSSDDKVVQHFLTGSRGGTMITNKEQDGEFNEEV